MKNIFFLFLLIGFSSFAQVTDSLATENLKFDKNDTLIYTVELEEVTLVAKRKKVSDEERKRLMALIRRVNKVYPYAKIAAERLVELNRNLARIKEKDRSKYLKLVEKYMENEFEAQLKKFSRKEGQILVKLVHRQTGETTFDLIKELKSSWKAFWYNKIGSLYDIDIKVTYNPKEEYEDYLIERILHKSFKDGRLEYQKAFKPVSLDFLMSHWKAKRVE